MAYNALRPTGTSLLKSGRHRQIRTFRFGLWSSYSDPEFQRELRRRHRMLKHKYEEASNGNGDELSFHWYSKAISKSMFRRYWNPAQMKCGTRFTNHDGLNGRQQQSRAAPDNEDGRAKASWPRIHAIYGSNSYGHDFPSSRNYNTWKSRLNAAMDHWTERTPNDTARAEPNAHSTKSASVGAKPDKKSGQSDSVSSFEGYIIDPITNRKVPTRTYGSTEDMTPPDSFRAYRAQFVPSKPSENEGNPGPIHSDGPPPPAELKEYDQVNIDQVPFHDVDSVGHDGTPVLGDNAESPRHPILRSEEYALNHLPPEESAEQHDDFDRYQAYQHTELDERVPEPTKTYEDLHKYKTYGAREAEDSNADVSPDHAELHEYRPYMHNESAKNENQTAHYDDLGRYGAYKYQEDKKHDSSPGYNDLDEYQHYNDESGKPVDDTPPKYEDLNKYSTADFHDSFVEERPFQEYGDLEKYRAFRYRELDNQNTLDRDVVAESLKEFDAKEQESSSIEASRPSIAERLQKLDLSDVSSAANSDSASLPSSSQKGHLSSAATAELRENLEQSMTSHNKASDAADREASSNIRESRARAQNKQSQVNQHKLTGNYVRDFPEEFSGSWGTRSSHSSLEPGVVSDSRISEQTAHIQAAEKQYADQLSESMDSTESGTSGDRQQAGSKLEPALDRRETGYAKNTFNHHSEAQAEVDPYSKEPQGLETSYTKECKGEETSPTFSKSYGTEPEEASLESSSTMDAIRTIHQFGSLHYRDPEIDGRPPTLSSDSNANIESSRTAEPMVYKILAYDPTMQKINIAETSSIVPDQATPLTPAEALLRLSNPAKFFPHFAPLQAEGFEIVSGGGDVLVFRQVRSPKAANQDTAAPVNPIDMMGKPTALPSAAAFVSPTGFVNYDIPPVEETQAPPFRSNIDVRREEPVFSGPKSRGREEARKTKKSLGTRMLIGGAWVAGISYALGVVSEYFITGGADGRGPTGF